MGFCISWAFSNALYVNGQASRFYCTAWRGSRTLLPQTFVVCLFRFPHRLVLCCFMYVSLVVSSMWFLCLSASYLFVSSPALLLFSLPRLPAISLPLTHTLTQSLSLSSPHLLLLLPPSHTLIPYLLLTSPHPPLPFLSIFFILAALPAADD